MNNNGAYLNIKVPRKVRNSFRANCIVKNKTMEEEVARFMRHKLNTKLYGSKNTIHYNENTDYVFLNLRVPRKLRDVFNKRCAKQNKTMTSVVNDFIQTKVKNEV